MQGRPICKNPNCNNEVNYKNSTIGYLHYCSNKCISSDPNIKQIKEDKSFAQFGTKAPAQSRQIKDKIIKTNQERYGANSPMCLQETQKKSKETLFLNYGVHNPGESEELIKKRVESFKANIDQYKESYRKTSLEKYGVDHPWMSNTIHKRSVVSSKIKKNEVTKKLVEEKLKNYPEYKLIDIDFTPLIKSIKMLCPSGHIFDINRTSLYERNINNSELCTICNPICKGISGMEIAMFNFIKANYTLDIVSNSRKVIPPHEVDIYLPDIKLAFEFNGLYWHSNLNKKDNYHRVKYDNSQLVGLNLITIWEDDWIYKQDIVKSFILNKLNKTQHKIYARKCTIKEISYSDSKNFLENNHLQGDVKSPIRVGLFHNNELVSLMTFSKLRLPLQSSDKKRNIEGHIELTRFCNKVYTNVIGGASKLLKYVINKYTPVQIETYSDNLISNGNLYEKLGFEYIHTSDPGYWYVIGGKREHRFNWRKQRLISLGYDANKTEEEIMAELGHYRIYNAGNKKWILKVGI
jgi:hypothetical protein